MAGFSCNPASLLMLLDRGSGSVMQRLMLANMASLSGRNRVVQMQLLVAFAMR